MAKTFADALHFNGSMLENYIIAIQCGQTKAENGGLPEMMYVTLKEFRTFMREGMASLYNYRGEYHSLPTDLAIGDCFYCDATFTEGGVTYTLGCIYAYNDQGTWDDITNIFGQYASQGEVDDINLRLVTAEGKLYSMVRHDNLVPDNPLPINADQLNGHPDTYFTSKTYVDSAINAINDDISALSPYPLRYRGLLLSGDGNLPNSAEANGYYGVGTANYQNLPDGYGTLIHIRSTYYLHQFFINSATNAVWMRGWDGTSYMSWTRIF